MKNLGIVLGMILMLAAPAFATVKVSSPTNGQTVTSPVPFVASATTGCSKGVASMGIYVDKKLSYTVDASTLKTSLKMATGKHTLVVEEWDHCGGATYTTLGVTVQASSGGGGGGTGGGSGGGGTAGGGGGTGSSPGTLTNLQAVDGWRNWGELRPEYNICSAPCPGVTWSLQQGIASPSLSGHASQFNIGGTVSYSDVLWSLPLMGPDSVIGMADENRTIIPSIHNFIYDVYFYGSDLPLTQVLEFDINMYLDGAGMIFGNQCRIAGGNEWDIWDNVTSHWIPTGVACNPLSNAWNHVTIEVEREPNNLLLYKTITLNGHTSDINQTYAPFTVPNGWYGVSVNYQMDGNYRQAANTTYLDNFTLNYW